MTTALGGGGDGGGGNGGSGSGGASGGGTGGNGSGGGNGGGAAGSGGGAASGGSGGGGGGGSAASWRDTLPDDIKTSPALANFQDVGALAKSYLHAQSQIGKKGVIVPGEKATDDDMRAFWKAIGQPDLEKFELTKPKEMSAPDELITSFKGEAHRLGMMPKQAQELLNWIAKEDAKAQQALRQHEATATKQALDGLKNELGAGYNKSVAFGHMAARELGGEDFLKYLNESGEGDNPAMIKFMAKVGELLGEDKLRGSAISNGFGSTKAEIKAEIEKTRADLKGPYFDSTHPGHKSAVARMEHLYQQLGA